MYSFTQTQKSVAFALFCLACTPLFAAGRDRGDISHVNKGISIDSGDRAGDLETVNGGIRVGENAVVRNAETVNGGVRLERGAHAESLETVNGGISVFEDATVARDVEAVNGGIRLAANAEVVGDVSNVNGGIELTRARVGGKLETTAGDLLLLDGSHVAGGLHIEKPTGMWNNWNQSRPPRVVVGANSVVGGELVFDREVELYVHESAKTGAIRGATAKRYSGSGMPAFAGNDD